MKSVLISIRPQWCELIASGKKLVEVRKTRPKIETPFKCYIYQSMTGYVSKSKENDILVPTTYGKVIGEFVCDRIEDYSEWKYDHAALLRHIDLYAATNGDYKFLSEYIPEKKGFGWHISDLVIYDKPKELGEFVRPCDFAADCGFCGHARFYGHTFHDCGLRLTRPPQSWMFVEELKCTKEEITND